jgi:hypothetical protein
LYVPNGQGRHWSSDDPPTNIIKKNVFFVKKKLLKKKLKPEKFKNVPGGHKKHELRFVELVYVPGLQSYVHMKENFIKAIIKTNSNKTLQVLPFK